LESADIVIVFISEAAIKKTGYVQKELRLIYDISLYKPDDTIFVIPLRLEECQPPPRFRLWQWGDYFGERKEDTYQSLLRALKQKNQQKLQIKVGQREDYRIEKEDVIRPKHAEKVNIALETENPRRKPVEKTEFHPKRQSGEKAQHELDEPRGTREENIRPESQINWQLPFLENVLDKGPSVEFNVALIEFRARLIQETLASLGAPVQVVEINSGSSITQYGVEPLFINTRKGRTKVRAAKIEGLADEIAVALAVRNVRIQVPVPGRSYIGIEVPNQKLTPIALRDIIESKLFQQETSPLKFVLGRDVMGQPVIATLEKMPNLLIAGSGRSGKSVCVDSLLACLLLRNTPNDLRLMLIDPKRVELTIYNGIPHLIAPVIVEVERVIGALQWVAREMDERYHIFAQIGARNISDYNARMMGSSRKKLPFLVMVVSDFANLMMAAPAETEQIITRLAKLARNTGIYMILVTQRPSGDVLTQLIKANFPARITFAVASNAESRVILDQPGAERLLGRGDMLFQAPGVLAPVRLQGAFIADHETQNLLEFWISQLGQDSPIPEITDMAEKIKPMTDPLLPEAIELVRREGHASTSMLQRHMRIGYTRAARIVDIMEDKGIVSPSEGKSRIRKILDYGTVPPPKDV
jgi:S-DNA-T family DNA segregation ATPase FtsK/SpoIIIE